MHETADQAAGAPEPNEEDFAIYLAPTYYFDFEDASVATFAKETVASETDPVEKARRLYYAVRDDIRYDPYSVRMKPEHFRASATLAEGRGFCINKAGLLTTAARAVGVPARVGYADVLNHLATPRLIEIMGGNELFIYHGYSELFLNGKWVKSTPAFNLTLCDKFRVLPLEFDPDEDSIFHPYDADGRRHMEYVNDRGSFADLPFEQIKRDFADAYPTLMQVEENFEGDFGEDAEEALKAAD